MNADRMRRRTNPDAPGREYPKPRKQFSPREYLKGRRPERFSDTLHKNEPSLDRALLEYHLEKLTSRGQEKDFETFARHLAQKEICPNLLPQTGPTGGGDSKVDSETYPVADHLTLCWYVGSGREAASERWAFAFSAKEDWRPKVRSDVEKIKKTERGYAKAFFVTNQFVPDRVRADVEDELTTKHGIDVRILDRTWILDKVFENQYEALAIEDLRLQTSIRTNIRKGPRDVQREQELEEVEGRIKNTPEDRLGYGFVDDCLAAAELARDLERPRTEVDGRFERTVRASEKYGSRHQRLVCAYSRAWTAFWWYEDYPSFVRHYLEVERLAEGSRNAHEFELLFNAWNILYSLTTRREVDEAEVALNERTAFLIAALDRLKLEEGRPSTVLQARALLLLMQLMMLAKANENVEPVLLGLQSIVHESRRLVGFPLEPLVDVLTELGGFLGQFTGYQELHETIIEVASERSGEVKAARLLLERGAQQLEADRPTDAIRSLGKALVRLSKHESRHDLVTALYLCGVAYERVGLAWAARGTILNAASIATNDYWSYEEVTSQQVACYNQLKWLELRLGRLPQIFAWHEIDRIARASLTEQGFHSSGYAESEMNFDAILGLLLLKTDIWHLKRLVRLPDMLDGLELPYSSIALRFALGDESSVAEDLAEFDVQSDMDAFFRLWSDQPAGDRLSAGPQLYDGRSVTLTSRILGCYITAESENVPACIALAESVLGALESLLSTGIVDHFIAQEPTLAISVRRSDFASYPFGHKTFDVDGRPHVEIRCGDFDWTNTSPENQASLKRNLSDLIATIVARVFVLGDMEHTLTKLFRDDRALERAIEFTVGIFAIGNVLGHSPRTSLSDWSDSEAREFPLTRHESWDAAFQRSIAGASQQPGADANPPESARELARSGRLAHSQVQTVSLIRASLWNQAKWSGTAFVWSMDASDPPLLAPIFKDAAAASQIFRLWHEELGDCDEQERLRVTIIRGIDQSQPHAYRVIFNVNLEPLRLTPSSGLTAMVARIHTMFPPSHENLDNFLKRFLSSKSYQLAHCTYGTDPSRAR